MSGVRNAAARRRLRTRVILGVAVPAALAVLVSCQLIVPGDVPEFTCTGNDPSACPSGLVCNPEFGTCVSPNSFDGGPDAPTPGTDGDAKIDTGPILQALGGDCARDQDCQSGLLCGTAALLTSAILGDGNPVCTKPCCTSDDCATGFICYAAGTGGNYCVSATLAQRTPSDAPGGGGKPGDTCGGDSDCRSGLCTDQRCLDTCCNDAPCGNGTVCRFVDTISGPTAGGSTATHSAWACALGVDGGKDSNVTCDGTSVTCKNNNCDSNNVCSPSCCSANDCTLAGFTNNVCAYGSTGTDYLKWCREPNPTGVAEGQTCAFGTDCASRFCDTTSKKCGRPCCQNSDCNKGESCKPTDSPTQPAQLRCIAD